MTLKHLPILTDVDGVLFDWEASFNKWMSPKYPIVNPEDYSINVRYNISKDEAKKYTKEFNECGWIGYLPVLRDAKRYVKKLIEEGYEFQAITSLSTDYFAGVLRRGNLESAFGTDMNCTCLDTGADKDNELKKYSPGHWWLEDKPENCEAGLKFGHKPILIDHVHNRWYNNPNVIRVETWKDIYNIITN